LFKHPNRPELVKILEQINVVIDTANKSNQEFSGKRMSPTIVKNNIAVSGNTELVLTAANLQATSTGIAEAQVLFTVSSLPSRGSLKLNGTALAVNGTFTQADITAGKVTYQSTGTATATDGFGFTVTDGTSSNIAASTQRVSVSSSGTQGNDLSGTDNINTLSFVKNSISADGRYVAYESLANNLVAGDTNSKSDIFVYDRQTNTNQRVSLANNGDQGNNSSARPVISADGRYVTFESSATNLVTGGTRQPNIFVRDLQAGTTELVSVNSSGIESNFGSSRASISADGRYVSFFSFSPNLIPENTSSSATSGNLFIRDRQAGTTKLVSAGISGNAANALAGGDSLASISADGRYVAFDSSASNLIAGDTNNLRDVFVRDLQTNTTQRVSIDNSGNQLDTSSSNPVITADGKSVAFNTAASNTARDTISVRDLVAGTTSIAVRDNGSASLIPGAGLAASADGRFITYIGLNSTSNGYALKVYDRQRAGITDEIVNVPLTSTGPLLAGYSISADGQFVSFASGSPLVTGDTNNVADVFVRNRGTSGLNSVSSNAVIAITAPTSTSLIPGVIVNRNLFTTDATTRGLGVSAISQLPSNRVNEIGLFAVDDLTGKIGNILPNSAGYLRAALDIATPLFTTLAGSFLNQNKQEFAIDPNKTYQFLEIRDGSIADLRQQLASGGTPTNVLFSLPDANGQSSIRVSDNNAGNGYKISVNNDELVLDVVRLVGSAPNIPIGSKSQTAPEGRTINLTDFVGQTLKADITTRSNAAYNNNIGFYAVEDAIGSIKLTNGNILRPGDANYAVEAVRSALTNTALQAGKTDSKINLDIAGGRIYAPVVVAQGSLNDFVATNPTNGGGVNDIHAYFNYLGANSDKVDHFRLIGNNTFGVEDIYGGGDRDFNDLIVNINLRSAA
jgi:Cadherin-like/Domain of unknown function (DUF4114)